MGYSSEGLEYTINHVFLPPKLPQEKDNHAVHDATLCQIVSAGAKEFGNYLTGEDKQRWGHVEKMLENFQTMHGTNEMTRLSVWMALRGMAPGDSVGLLIRAQNAGVIFRMTDTKMTFEAFEVSPPAKEVLSASGKLICTYPGPAISFNLQTFKKESFQLELAGFLAQMHNEKLSDASAVIQKAGSSVENDRDSSDPKYVTTLLTGILRGQNGKGDFVPKIHKRIADEVLMKGSSASAQPWRRSSLWLVMRVALQIALLRQKSDPNHVLYKSFMIFLHAHILSLALEQKLHSDLLFSMRAKMGRRVHKLGDKVFGFVREEAKDIGERVQDLLQDRMEKLYEAQAESARWAPQELNVRRDAHLQMRNSSAYIEQALTNTYTAAFASTFDPGAALRLRDVNSFTGFDANTLQNAFTTDPYVGLADFEEAVAEDLQDWVEMNKDAPLASRTLLKCMRMYFSTAQRKYDSNPEDQSVMVLTMFSLWVALDTVATHQCPLLKNYSPEVNAELPHALLRPLLLRKQEQLRRLAAVERYVRNRRQAAVQRGTSIFTDSTDDSTFQMVYFNTSQDHQELLARIKAQAELQRSMKIAELDQKMKEYNDLRARIDKMDHTHGDGEIGFGYVGSRKRKRYTCRKCELEATIISIVVHEWPLPSDEDEAKVVVFELRPPPVFARWRAATMLLLFDLCTPPDKHNVFKTNPRAAVSLNDSPLFPYVMEVEDASVVSVRSRTRPFSSSHLGHVTLPTTAENVCVNCGLDWKLWDSKNSIWVGLGSKLFSETSTWRYGTQSLAPHTPYSLLQPYVRGTRHTSNVILANQIDCPPELNLHEYFAFAGLRSGARLQWMNIVRELRARVLAFSHEAVHTLVTQAAWQVGPLSDLHGEHEYHIDLMDAAFGEVLLRELTSVLRSVEGNWKEGITVRTIIFLASRLLASARDQEIIEGCYMLLKDCRRVTFTWTLELVQAVQNCEERFIQQCQYQLCETAATCRSTFDVDPSEANLDALIGLNAIEDIRIFLQCAIVLCDNKPHDVSTTPRDFQKLLERDRRLAHMLESRVRDCVRANREGADRAIAGVWVGYQRGTQWRSLAGPADRWLVTDTAERYGQVSQRVHLNLLLGRLLINGKPLGRLPPEIVGHSVYMRVFSNKVLDVFPAEMPGMEFATKSLVSGHRVFFRLQAEDQLIIRAQKTEEDPVHELIPHTRFEGDLPTLFVEHHVHWLNLTNGDIEIRPLESMWESSESNWVIRFNSPHRVCVNSTRAMIDIHSRSFNMIAGVLERFEHAEYLTVSCSQGYDTATLSVDLPRYRLSFFRNRQNQLECGNFPDMVVDPDQSIGALLGLQNRLVLGGKDATLANCRRRVLIPYGTVTYGMEGDHVMVNIDTLKDRSIPFANYTIDTDLGYLVGNGSLRSRLYQIYLQGLTSFCLPDPLTQRTGTEEALSEFYGAAIMSFRELGKMEKDLLVQISCITAGRFFAPLGNPTIQSVNWHNLPSLSQHYGFLVRAREIIEYSEHLAVFAEESNSNSPADTKKKEIWKGGEPFDRAAHRNRLYYPADIPGKPTNQPRDVVYVSRDTSLVRETDVFRLSLNLSLGYFYRCLPTPFRIPTAFSEWQTIGASKDNLNLSYSSAWLTLKMRANWLAIYTTCISDHMTLDEKKYKLLFSLSAMVYGDPDCARYVYPILASLSNGELRDVKPSACSSSAFNLSYGVVPGRSHMLDVIGEAALALEFTPSDRLERREEETRFELQTRKNKHLRRHRDAQAAVLQEFLIAQWPAWSEGRQATLESPSRESATFFDLSKLMDSMKSLFVQCNQNRKLLDHAKEVYDLVKRHYQKAREQEVDEYNVYLRKAFPMASPPGPTLEDLLNRVPPAPPQRAVELIGNPNDVLENPEAYQGQAGALETGKLKNLLKEIMAKHSVIKQLYAIDLEDSRQKFHSLSTSSLTGIDIPDNAIPLLNARKETCEGRFQATFDLIKSALSPITEGERALLEAGVWPKITRRSLLSRLAHPFNKSLTPEWLRLLTCLARDCLEYQRVVRLLSLAQLRKCEDFFKELDTHTFDEESALKYPDWAVIQIEGNFLARRLQIQVAEEMINPSSGGNTVLQLNMGEGKSSVIAPLVAAALANGTKAVRVVVLKPLAGQMFQLLMDRLSGLANRRIFYMPFSRKVRVGVQDIRNIQSTYQTCMEQGGIWVVQPEHILSFKLMSIDRCLVASTDDELNVAEKLAESQRWLDENVRDVLDESDEILHVRYQLIYTVGQQEPLELQPDRWTIAQELFSLVAEHVPNLKESYANGLDVQPCSSGSFIPVRILQDLAGRRLIERIVEDIFKGRLSNFNVRFLPPAIRELAKRFVTEKKIEACDVDQLMTYCNGSNDWGRLLLLRGLIAHGILIYVLQDRQWRVDYGLDLSRSMLAVPYRAKDVPSVRSEFGHADVAVTLTCLTYYYQGLSSSQLSLCLDLLFKLDNPQLEYSNWVANDATIPPQLQSLNGINTDDAEQHNRYLLPLFSKRKTVVDFYLSHVVFPKAAKEFKFKLSSSGWDLAERKRGHLTTGFSGTNDNRYLLPTSISQQDPLSQGGTNAKVLMYLMQKENNFYHRIARPDGGHLSVEEFLQFLVRETARDPVQVLLDVGAQMLDLKNDELAKKWLELRPDMSAAIFFNDKDEMSVVMRDGAVELLISSPFRGQLEKCLVYLDDAHTRGTDLKLPVNSRAAVTLGPKVTKDRLIQGCMRMRKLGHGQHIIFFAPSEIDRSIRDQRPRRTNIKPSTKVSVTDILRWSMFETCSDIMHHVPHWAEQGYDYIQRRKAWDKFTEDSTATEHVYQGLGETTVEKLKEVWQQPEARSLQVMYGIKSGPSSIQEAVFSVPELKERLEKFGVTSLTEVDMDEEQEREVDHEVEQERQIERPPKAVPAEHRIAPGVRRFVQTGELPTQNIRDAFIRLFASLDGFMASAPANGSDIWTPGLWATKDFAITLAAQEGNIRRGNTEYLRPVNWILTSRKYEQNNVFVVLSPFEVNQLLPEIRHSTNVTLHMYAPRVTREMKSFDDLRFYSVPRLTADTWQPPRILHTTQIGLFAGQLYLDNYEVYRNLCEFLGLHNGDQMLDAQVQSDGLVRPEHRNGTVLDESRFLESPIPFLEDLVSARRKGSSYLPTHLGKILHGRVLEERDFA